MRGALFHSIVLLMVLGSSLSAQPSPDDMRRLRELLRLEPGKEIPNAASPKLPAGIGPLRVFLATVEDKEIRSYYAREIKQWNKYKDASVVALELVDDVSSADVILARFKLNEKPQTSTTSVAVYEQVFDPVTRTTVSRPEIKSERTRTVRYSGYILLRKGPDIAIVRRRIVAETKKEGTLIVEGLWTTFIELVSAP